MASYLSSYFSSNSNSQSQQYQQQRPSTPSSTWSSAFSSRITTLRKALTKDSEEDEPDNEDCSHVSNVLRAYYTEKGRAFPEWLPPDPKKPVPVIVQPQNQYGQYGGYGGSQYGTQPTHGRGPSAGRGLSDLWDPSPAPPVTTGVQSLRAPRPTLQTSRSQESNMLTSSASGATSLSSQQALGARPLPSQRAGSYQTTPSAAAGGLGSRDRLRARLQSGERSSSPLGTGSALQAYGGNGSYSSQGSSGGASPYVSASEPWSTAGNEYGYSGGSAAPPSSGGQSGQSGQYGSSSNPRQRLGNLR